MDRQGKRMTLNLLSRIQVFLTYLIYIGISVLNSLTTLIALHELSELVSVMWHIGILLNIIEKVWCLIDFSHELPFQFLVRVHHESSLEFARMIKGVA